MDCRLVTWNLHGLPPPLRIGVAAHIRRAADETCRRKPDVALFQEVWLESYADEIIGHCKTAGYAPVLSRQGGRSTGGLVMLYRAANWSPSKSAFTTFRRHAPALRVWEADGISRKGVLITVLTAAKTGAAVTVATTHLQSQYGSHHYEEVRAAQIRELETAIAAVASTGQPVILAGDFNTTPADRVYSRIQQQWVDLTADYRESCERKGRDSCGTYFAGKLPNDWIDYVFVRRTGGLTAAGTVQLIRNKKADDPFSDHEGLQADISITKSSSASRLFQQILHQLSNSRPVTRRSSLSILVRLFGVGFQYDPTV